MIYSMSILHENKKRQASNPAVQYSIKEIHSFPTRLGFPDVVERPRRSDMFCAVTVALVLPPSIPRTPSALPRSRSKPGLPGRCTGRRILSRAWVA